MSLFAADLCACCFQVASWVFLTVNRWWRSALFATSAAGDWCAHSKERLSVGGRLLLHGQRVHNTNIRHLSDSQQTMKPPCIVSEIITDGTTAPKLSHLNVRSQRFCWCENVSTCSKFSRDTVIKQQYCLLQRMVPLAHWTYRVCCCNPLFQVWSWIGYVYWTWQPKPIPASQSKVISNSTQSRWSRHPGRNFKMAWWRTAHAALREAAEDAIAAYVCTMQCCFVHYYLMSDLRHFAPMDFRFTYSLQMGVLGITPIIS
jgi:hypothetical protein